MVRCGRISDPVMSHELERIVEMIDRAAGWCIGKSSMPYEYRKVVHNGKRKRSKSR